MRTLDTALHALLTAFALMLASASAALASWPDDPTVNFPVSVAAGDQFWVRSASDGAGGIISAWLDQRATPTQVYAQRVSASGVVMWTADGVAVSTAGILTTPLAIVSDGAGGAIIAWTSYPGVAGTDIFAQRLDASGTPLWGPGGVPVCTAAGNQANAVLAPGGDGGAIVVWNDSRSGAAGYYAQRLSASGLALWTPDGGRVVSIPGSSSAIIVADGTGGAFLAMPFFSGTANAIFGQRVDVAGAPQWGEGGLVVWPSAGSQSHPAIALDGAGGAYFLWGEFAVGPGARILGERLDAAGTRLWSPGAVTIASGTSTGSLDTIAVIPVEDGAILAWTDLRFGSLGIRAQRFDTTGALQWDASGVSVCSTVSTQYGLGLADDGEGGALLSWNDTRNGAADIYAQALDPYGLIRWGPIGLAVCTAAGFQMAPGIVSDGWGGAVMAWQDARSGVNTDIFAQRVHATGTLDVPPAPGARLLLAAPAPSPARIGSGASIRFALAEAGVARLGVFDVAGRQVRALAAGALPAGERVIHWDAHDDAGRSVPPGLYLIRLEAAGRVASAKLVLAR